MIEQQVEPQLCYACDAEFIVYDVVGDSQQARFCPYCGNDVDNEEDDLLFDDTLDDIDEWK